MASTIPYEKLSKKEKKQLNESRRTTWGTLNPITRKPKNPKAYIRKKAQHWDRDPDAAPFCFA